MRTLLNRDVLAPLAMILTIQSIVTMSSYAIPVAAPAIATDLGIAPVMVGALVSVVYVTGMAVGLLSATLVARFGAWRGFQIMLALTGVGILLMGLGHPLWLLAGAVLIGAGTGPMNPTGSHVLARVSPSDWQPFVFSIKQCGTPAGGMLAGLVLPPLMLLYDWQLALAVIPAAAALCIVLVGLAAQPRQPRATAARFSVAAALGALRLVTRDRILRRFVSCGMAFAAGQMAITTYIVVYLWSEIGLAMDMAGLIFSVVHGAGIAARIVLGAIAGRWVSSRALLVLLGLVMACGATGLALSNADWPVPAFVLLAVVTGIGGNGWVGLFFSEMARRAPAGHTAEAAGGGQFYVYIGIVAGPLLASALITAIGYAVTFAVFAAITALASLALHRLGAAN